MAVVAHLGLATRISSTLAEADDRPIDDDPTPVVFSVRPGATAAEVGEDLQRAGLIRSATTFRVLAGVNNAGTHLQVGEYELRRDMSVSDVLQVLASGRTVRNGLVTVPEGWRAEEIAQHLEAQGVTTASAFVEAVRSPSLVAELAPGGNPNALEGYLFPDSYDFGRDPTPQKVVRTMVGQFERRVSPGILAQAKENGLSYQGLITLASIIEREAVAPEDRAKIATVFHNRLDRGMPLQADPTTQYALVPFGTLTPGLSYWKRELTQVDLRAESPYNTYRSSGLPPGPICNPGLASIEAAANPVPGPWLYFVARGDGTHLFAQTLDEHNRNVAQVNR